MVSLLKAIIIFTLNKEDDLGGGGGGGGENALHTVYQINGTILSWTGPEYAVVLVHAVMLHAIGRPGIM